MAESRELVFLLFRLAVMSLLLVTALFLAFAPPASRPKRLLAAALAFLGVAQLQVVSFLPGNPIGAPAHVWTRFWQDLFSLANVALVAFFWHWPTRVKLRSWHGAVLVGGLVVFATEAALNLLRPALFFAGDPSRGVLNAWGRFVTAEGENLFDLLVAASALSRALPLEPRERRAALVIVPAVYAREFGLFGSFVTMGIEAAAGAPFRFVASRAGYPGDPLGILLVVAVGYVALSGALSLWLAVRHASYVALALQGWALARWVIESVADAGFSVFSMYYLFTSLAVLHAIDRHGAFGSVPPHPAWGRLAGAFALTGMFLATLTIGLATLGESALALALTMFGALALGVLAVGVAQPSAFAPLVRPPDDPATTERRLSPYRAALAGEIARGAAPREASERLRPLRRELGVSDLEHAAMDHALRASAAPGGEEAVAALSPGRRFLDRYLVLRKLGEGGSGEAHLCRDELVGREVAIKTFRADRGGADALRAALKEARALGGVRHPNVVDLLDVVQVGDALYVVMEFAQGGSLADRIRSGPIARSEWRGIALDVLGALEAVHAAGLVHRDVKPSNVLLAGDGRAKLADFGIARSPQLETTAGGLLEGGGAPGTVRFMSPEQAKGQRVSAASDLYSAAATLYEAWTGRPYLEPRPGESPIELRMRASRGLAFPAAFTGPPPLRSWFERALAPAVADRFGSAAEMRAGLESALAGDPSGNAP